MEFYVVQIKGDGDGVEVEWEVASEDKTQICLNTLQEEYSFLTGLQIFL